MSIETLDVPDWLVARSKEVGLQTVRELICSSESVLADKLCVSMSTAKALINEACMSLAPVPFGIGNIQYFKILGWQGLPILFKGGISEISGAAGTGKTQLCFTITAQADFDIIYWIDTEGTFSSERIIEISGSDKILNKVRVKQVRSLSVLQDTISLLNTVLHSSTGTALIIIDSIAAVAREVEDIRTRQKTLHGIAENLKKLNGVVLLTNHARDNLESTGVGRTIPALGNTWSCAVNSRIMLFRENIEKGNRHARILKAPAFLGSQYQTEHTFRFSINTCGWTIDSSE